MSVVTVRDARGDDIETIVAFNVALALETESKHLDRATLRAGVEAVLRDSSKGFYLVAQTSAAVVGQLMITTEWSDWRNADWWWLQSVYVEPAARRDGVFRALWTEVVARSKSAGVRGLRLYVENENSRAQETYAALGMRRARYAMYELGQE